MAFTGTAVLTPLGKGTILVGEVSLAAAAVGTIGPAGSGADVELPEGFGVGTEVLTLPQAVYWQTQVYSGAPVQVDLLGGSMVRVTNPDAEAGTGGLLFQVHFLHTATR
jgi:hypothetical protein